MTKEEYIEKIDREIKYLEWRSKKLKEIKNEIKMKQCFVIGKPIVSAE